MAVKQIRDQGRNTMGVRIIRLEEGDEVRDAVVLAPTLDANGSSPEGPGSPEAGSPAEPAAEEASEDEAPDDAPEDDDGGPAPAA